MLGGPLEAFLMRRGEDSRIEDGHKHSNIQTLEHLGIQTFMIVSVRSALQ